MRLSLFLLNEHDDDDDNRRYNIPRRNTSDTSVSVADATEDLITNLSSVGVD